MRQQEWARCKWCHRPEHNQTAIDFEVGKLYCDLTSNWESLRDRAKRPEMWEANSGLQVDAPSGPLPGQPPGGAGGGRAEGKAGPGRPGWRAWGPSPGARPASRDPHPATQSRGSLSRPAQRFPSCKPNLCHIYSLLKNRKIGRYISRPETLVTLPLK